MEFMVSDSQIVVYINYNLVTKKATITFYIFFFLPKRFYGRRTKIF